MKYSNNHESNSSLLWTIRGRFSSSAGMMYPPASCRAASGAPPHRSTAGHERGGGREGGFQNGIRSWISTLRLSLSILGGMLCCGGRSSPRRLSTGTRWADGWAGGLLRSWSTFGCARTAEGSTATGVLCRRKPTTLATRRSCSTRRSANTACTRRRGCSASAGDDPSLWRDRNSASVTMANNSALQICPAKK